MTRNPQPEYWQLLATAYDTGEAVDLFDLDSDDPESVKEWERLCGASADAQCDLINFVECHGRKLRRAFEA